MNRIKAISYWLKDKLFVLFAILLVLLPTCPLNSPYAQRDSGVFLYAGWRILNGRIPYVDFWDHKPPIIFYINALGLALSDNSRWGVWMIELISLFIAAYLGYRLILKLFGQYAAMVSTFIWLLALVFLLLNGNLTEEYALPLQFATLYLFYLSRHDKRRILRYFIIGVLGGIAFFTKQTSIGVWLAIIIYLGFAGIKNREIKKSMGEILIIVLGGLLVSIIICTYFYINHALYEFWNSAFVYNYYFSTQKVSEFSVRLKNFIEIFSITRTGIFHLAALGIVSFIALSKKKLLDSNAISLLTVAMIDFPLELLIINVTGSAPEHYFITILPVLALFSGVLFFIIDQWISSEKKIKFSNFVLIFLTIGFLAYGSLSGYLAHTQSLQIRENEPAIQYIIKNTDSDDSILVWGAEAMVNFYSKRISPTRFVYLYPLDKQGYTTEKMINEFLDDIINKKPKIILDTMKYAIPTFSFLIQNDEIKAKFDYIKSIYVKVDEINSWQVYRLALD